jgi:hypothetical protein
MSSIVTIVAKKADRKAAEVVAVVAAEVVGRRWGRRRRGGRSDEDWTIERAGGDVIVRSDVLNREVGEVTNEQRCDDSREEGR